MILQVFAWVALIVNLQKAEYSADANVRGDFRLFPTIRSLVLLPVRNAGLYNSLIGAIAYSDCMSQYVELLTLHQQFGEFHAAFRVLTLLKKDEGCL